MQRHMAAPATENEWQPRAQPFTRRSHYPKWCSGNLSGEDGKKNMIGRKAVECFLCCLLSLVKPITASQSQLLLAMGLHERGWSRSMQSYLLYWATSYWFILGEAKTYFIHLSTLWWDEILQRMVTKSWLQGWLWLNSNWQQKIECRKRIEQMIRIEAK